MKSRPLGLRLILTLGVFTASTLVSLVYLDSSAKALQTPAIPPEQMISSLKTIPVPGPDPSDLAMFVKNKEAAIALGKALFWDMQAGSDGIQSCASCHFQAGADPRVKNQISPGLARVHANLSPNPDNQFNTGGSDAGPNYVVKPADFPFHKLANPDDANSVIADSNDTMSSQGVFNTKFDDINPGSDVDQQTLQADPVFNVNGLQVRRVEPRNTPTTINAVFNFRNFWDGRAQNEFNGVNPFGDRDVDAFVLKHDSTKQPELEKVKISLKNSSLASQAVGPPLSDFEMSAAGRTFPKIGKKLLALRPLGKQQVASDDSVLGPLAASPVGLTKSYIDLIKEAFKPEWWNSDDLIKINPDKSLTFIDFGAAIFSHPTNTNEYTQMEYNFSLFWGLAIQMYEATLVADDSPVDRFFDGNNSALTTEQKRGLAIFLGQGRCINCHGGAETTNASVRNVRNQLIERMRMGDGGIAVYDNGFYNIGVRPSLEDVGVGGNDPFGNPLSFTRLFQVRNIPHPIEAVPEDSIPAAPLNSTERAAVRGSHKTPGLRNVELTAPYFHNGGQATLRQVVEFYNRGGDFANENRADLDPDIQPLGLTNQQKEDLVAFLVALTDDRARFERAPFDHPALVVTNGHPGNSRSVTNDGTGRATDRLVLIPAVGRNGRATAPETFLQGQGGRADLSVNISTGQDPVMLGDNITYQIQVSNGGPDPGQNVVLNTPVPAGATFVSASAGCALSGNSVNCPFGTLQQGNATIVTIVFKVTGAVSTLTAMPTVNSLNDPSLGNNGTSRSVGVTMLTSLSMTSISAGSTRSNSLSVNGTNFTEGATVLWNGAPRSTTFVSREQLRIKLTPADLATPAKVRLTVMIPNSSSPSNPKILQVVSGQTRRR